MSGHSAESVAGTWRDYCKHFGSCDTRGVNDRCIVRDDPAYIAFMEARDESRATRVTPPGAQS